MYILKVEDSFSAAHKLIDYKGNCSQVHGHNWKVSISIVCYKTSKIGLTIDFKDIKKIFGRIIDQFDHVFLNNLPHFSNKNPTSENIAKVIYQLSSSEFKDDNTKVQEIAVKESDKYTAVYRPDENN